MCVGFDRNVRCCYVVQVINLLNTDELMVLLVNDLIIPRTFHVEPSQVMYVSGLGRIDYIQVGLQILSRNLTSLCLRSGKISAAQC